jgi:hypothetical protein
MLSSHPHNLTLDRLLSRQRITTRSDLGHLVKGNGLYTNIYRIGLERLTALIQCITNTSAPPALVFETGDISAPRALLPVRHVHTNSSIELLNEHVIKPSLSLSFAGEDSPICFQRGNQAKNQNQPSNRIRVMVQHAL